MTKDIKVKEQQNTFAVNKWDFITGMFIITTVMLFASLTSAYLVRRAEGNWFEFKMPIILWISTGVLVLSSIFMQLAYFSAKKDNFSALKLFISITFALGIAFLVLQVKGFYDLADGGVYLVGPVSGSFSIVYMFLHAVHIVAGLTLIAFVLKFSFDLKVHKTNLTLIKNTNTFWHFLDFLWIYVFLFLQYFR